MKDADLPSTSPLATPQPDKPIVTRLPEAFSPPGDSPGAFPFLPSPTMPCSVEEIGLNVVFDPPRLREERPATHLEGQRASAEALDNDNQHHEPGHTWALMLVVSYASAVTLALAWILWTGRRLPPSRVETDAPLVSTPEVGPGPGSWDRVRTDEPSAPLPPQNLTTLGIPIRLGSIEITPLAVELAPLDLTHSIDPGQTRQTQTPSLILRVRLSNESSDQIFAPLEISSVREVPGLRNETFLESERGRTGMYPLAMESEWSLVGQQYANLQPAESIETLLATAPILEEQIGDILTWRIRLRVTPHQTDVLGVTFSRDEIVDR